MTSGESDRPDLEIDIAAYFGGQPPDVCDILLPPGVDLLVLDHVPLELAGKGQAAAGSAVSKARARG